MKITVQTTEGPQEVIAKIYGPLAVHRKPEFNLEKDPDLWTVTHIQTGMTLTEKGKGLPKDVAIQFAESLKDLDWNFSEPDEAPIQTRRALLEAVQTLTAGSTL